ACVGSRVHPVASPQPVAQGVTTLDRMTVRTGEQQVQVDSPVVIARRVEHIVQEAGGYLERSSASSNGNARVEARVPAAELDGIMDEVAGLGKEKQRRITGTDVTDQYTDLEARLRSSIALRDRLQQLLGRAATLDDVLGLEKQIARLQVAIDGTVDAAAIYLRGVFFVTTTYGRTVAIDAASGAIRWQYTPSEYGSWAGSYRMTTATPVADPDRVHLYAASPDGRIQKL